MFQISTRTRPYLILLLVTLAARVLTALPLERAGYMDASYTFHVAQQLAAGRGFSETVLWNYLDTPRGLPHPSNLYWLPLPAMLAAPFVYFLGANIHAAQIPFIILSSFLPLIAFYLARRVTQRDELAWAAGLITAFSGFYTIYWVVPDNFTPFALTTALALIFIANGLEKDRARDWFGAGVCIGLSHLSRADGIFLLGVIPLGIFFHHQGTKTPSGISDFLRVSVSSWLVSILGYALVMTPWLARNFIVIGSPLPPGALQTVFLAHYDEFFRFNVADLTLARYLAQGLVPIVASKLDALVFGLGVLTLGVLQVFLVPPALVGVWRTRRRAEFLPLLIYVAVLYLTLSLVFTFPAMHGSLLHSSAALIPFTSVLAVVGLDSIVEWFARRRRVWNVEFAKKFFRVSAILLAFGLSAWLYAAGVFPMPFVTSSDTLLWNARDVEYRAVAQQLDALNVPRDEPILTVDPPSFANDTGRRSIYIPSDDAEAVFAAAQKYGAHYLVLQYDHVYWLDDLYGERATIPGFVLVARFKDGIQRPVFLFRVEP